MSVAIPAIGELLSTLSNRFGGAMLSGMVSAASSSPLRLITYSANQAASFTPLAPDVSSLLWLGASKRITTDSMWSWLRFHGVPGPGTIWDHVFAASQVWPDPKVTITAKRRGWLNDAQFSKMMKQSGWYDPDVWALMLAPPWQWSPEDIRRYAAAYGLGQNTRQQLLSAYGMNRAEDTAMLDALFTPTTPFETLQLLNRGKIDAETADSWLSLGGMTNSGVRAAFSDLRFVIPSASDLIRFSVKEVWNEQVVRDLGYDDEFDQIPAFKEWMQRQGYGGSPRIEGLGAGQPETWAQAFWRAHWDTPSNTQSYTMLHRLRPTGGLQGGPPGSGHEAPRVPTIGGQPVKPVTMADVAEVLKINDYPPIWRSRLAAISYMPLRLVDINRIVSLCLESDEFAAKVLPKGWTIEQWAAEEYMDRGQTREQADRLATLAVERANRQIRAAERRREAPYIRQRIKLVLTRYRMGIIDRPTAFAALEPLLHMPAPRNRLLDDIDLRKRTEDLADQIRWIHKQYEKGYIGSKRVEELLTSIGLVQSEVKRYLARWDFQFDADGRVELTWSILREYQRGLNTHDVAMARLTNLGWTDAAELLAGEVAPPGLG
jgi:hypothetical protein